VIEVGVSIEIPEPYGSQLRQARASFGDPLAATIPSHITLIPPLAIAESDLDDFVERLEAAAAAVPAYVLRLRGTGTFRPVSSVVFVAVSKGISYTEMLQARIRDELGDTVAPAQFPFHPHVTVAHDLDEAALDRADETLKDFECEFAVESLALYVRDEAQGWVPRRTFPLRLAGSAASGSGLT